MNKTNQSIPRGYARLRQLFAILFLITLFTKPALAQSPYIMAVGGGTCLGQSANLVIVNATATNWYVTPSFSGAITNITSTSATVNCLDTGTYVLHVDYIGGPSGQPTGTLSIPATVRAIIHPTFTLSASRDTVCAGATVTYTGVATGCAYGYSIDWWVDDVFTAAVYNSGVFSTNTLSSGSHTIKGVLWPDGSCSDPQMIALSTTTVVTATPTITGATTICDGGSTTLTAHGAAGYTWSPAAGLNTTTGSTVIASPFATTTYTVTGSGCAAPQQVTVTVDPGNALSGSPCAPPAPNMFSSRKFEPVVLAGTDIALLAGKNFEAADVVGFIYKSGAWQQIPIQVDEKKAIEYGAIYDPAYTPTATPALINTQFCDAGTYVGADSDTKLDTDDELVFMARDAGGIAPGTYPPGVVTSSSVQVKVTNTLTTPNEAGYVYLFKRASSAIVPSASKSYVNYNFSLNSGTYLSTYNLLTGNNPENSTVVTPYYNTHFSDRWLQDQLKITIGSSADSDLLDRHKSQFAPGACGRTEYTFNMDRGAFIVNKNGPIRAIRSYIGANSGPYTQRSHLFYEANEVITTNLRVHAIPAGIMDYYDYNPGAGSMIYNNNLNNTATNTVSGITGQGIVIDGSPDTLTPGELSWEMVNSTSGTILRYQNITHDDPNTVNITSYYLDTNNPERDSTVLPPSSYQCSGDLGWANGVAWGSSGVWINQGSGGLPNTDPRYSPYNTFTQTTVNFYVAPEVDRSQVNTLLAPVNTPMTLNVTTYPVGSSTPRPAVKPEEAVEAQVKINVYPNPSSGIITVALSGGEKDDIDIKVLNSKGHVVYSNQGKGNITERVDLKASGVRGQLYVAYITIAGKKFTKKILVNK